MLCSSRCWRVVGAASGGLFSATPQRLQGERRFFQQYQREAFDAQERFRKSETYPGAIRDATPGDTKHYLGGAATMHLGRRQRHYWRPVVDDPDVEDVATVRVRFKDQVWVTNGWETRMHVIEVVAPRTATLAEVAEQVKLENRSPYLCQTPFALQVDGKACSPSATVAELQITDESRVDAVEAADHLSHLPEHSLKDWHVEDITDDELANRTLRYRDLGIRSAHNLKPRYQAVPKAPSSSYGRM